MFELILSVVELARLSVRDCERFSLVLSTSGTVSKICPIDKFCISFRSSSCFNRCLCSATRKRNFGDSIATFIELSNNVRK